MSEKPGSSLEDLFTSFEARKHRAKENREAEDSTESASQRAIRVLREIVAPELQSLSARIVAEGHRAEVEEHLDNSSSPGLSLIFQPVTRDQLTPVPPSKLDFVHSPTEALSVRSQIWGQQGEVSQYSIAGIASAPVPLDKVDRAWVETQVTSFVSSVLKAN